MRKTFAILAIVAIAASACSKVSVTESQEPVQEGTPHVFTAISDPGTKTSLNPSTGVISWTSTDQIAITPSTANKASTFTIKSCSGNTAEFEGTIADAAEYYAIYPASAFVKFDTSKNKIQFNVPAEQTACLGTFADNVNVAVAHTDDGTLNFYNVLSYVYFDLQQDDITKVEITGKNSETLAGLTCKVQIAVGAAPAYSDNPGGTKYTTVSIGDGSAVLAKGKYFIALLPNKDDKAVNLKTGFTMTLTNSEGKAATKETSNALKIDMGTAKNLGTISGLTFGNTLEVDKAIFNVGSDAGSSEVNVTSSTSWTAAISGEGFSIDKASGSGDDVITVSYTANTDTEKSRTATLTITSDDSEVDPVEVTFTQAKLDTKVYKLQFTVGSSTDLTQNATGTPGGTLTFGSNRFGQQSPSYSSSGYDFKLDGDASAKNTKYVLVTLNNDETLAAGDVITISGYQTSTNDPANKTVGYKISSDNAASNSVALQFTVVKNTMESIVYTVTSSDVLVGKNAFYITRNNQSAYFVGITIE